MIHPRFAVAQGRRAVRRAVNPWVRGRQTGPQPDQKPRIVDFLAGDGPRWLIWFDGGRADWFERLHPEYLDGEYRRVWNGGLAYSGHWATEMLDGTYPDLGLFSSLPVRDLKRSDYDGRDHFAVAPDVDTRSGVDERLAALGYISAETDGQIDVSPGHVNDCVRDHLRTIDGGVIRYLKPHPPLDGLEDLTSGGRKITETWRALIRGDLASEELEQAYERTYRQAFEALCELLPALEGEVVVTADHGECLGDCGQLFHGPWHTPHDHLATVPWLRVDR